MSGEGKLVYGIRWFCLGWQRLWVLLVRVLDREEREKKPRIAEYLIQRAESGVGWLSHRLLPKL